MFYPLNYESYSFCKKIRNVAEFFTSAEEERFELSEPVKVQQFSRLSY